MQPPLTPMIDVTFQLLIFFILTAQFRDEGNIPGSLPKAGTVTEPDKVLVKPVYVIVQQQGTGEASRPVYAVSFRNFEEPIPQPSVGDAAEYRDVMAQRLHEALQRHYEQIKSQASKEEDIRLVIRPQADERGHLRWQYVAEAFNQAVRAKFEQIGFEWRTYTGFAGEL